MGRHLNCTSNHPVSAKRLVAYVLINRTDHINLEGEQTAKEERIKEDLRANGYPETFFMKHDEKSTRRRRESANTRRCNLRKMKEKRA